MKKKVFIVDDDAAILRAHERVCSRLKNEISISSFLSPMIALQEASVERPALVISDFLMSEMNGDVLLARMKQICPEAKTILVSGTHTMCPGADRCLGKPAVETLRAAIRELLGL